jgi:radical SAM-linked protein
MARTQPEQHPPPVQWLRVRYARRGRARFTSHRDFGRAFERALRRARVPMAYSSGFSPHPRISYPNAAPTGAASEAEYVEIGLARACEPDEVRAALDAALPEGLDILAVAAATPGGLADLLTGSRWRIALVGLEDAMMREAVAAFLASETVQVERMTKTGLRTFDARAAVAALSVVESGLDLVLAHTVPLVRPDDVLSALSRLEPRWQPGEPPRMTRLQQGLLTERGPDGSPVIDEPL